MTQKEDIKNTLSNKGAITVLAIESSCDETACAVVRENEVLSSVISSQIDIHRKFGGVVPEIASRNHTINIGSVVSEALERSGLSFADIDAIAVTYGAGLLGALLVGVSYAKGLSYALKKPLIAVNHIYGHIAANYLANPELKPPYIALIVSGGHTAVAKISDYHEIEILGSTADDAVGEAFDKVARVLGLPYPGGPEIEKLAKQGAPVITMPTVKMKNDLDFSYSGLKTAVINYVHNKEQKGEDIARADLAASFQSAAVKMLVTNAVKAALRYGMDKIAVAGGVGANSFLREELGRVCVKNKLKCFFPTREMCTDNACMIAREAIIDIRQGVNCADFTLDAKASIRLWDCAK